VGVGVRDFKRNPGFLTGLFDLFPPDMTADTSAEEMKERLAWAVCQNSTLEQVCNGQHIARIHHVMA